MNPASFGAFVVIALLWLANVLGTFAGPVDNGVADFEPFDFNHYRLVCEGLSDNPSSRYIVSGVVSRGVFTGQVSVGGQNAVDTFNVVQNGWQTSRVNLSSEGTMSMELYWVFENMPNKFRSLSVAGKLDNVVGSWTARPVPNSVDNYGEYPGGGLRFSKFDDHRGGNPKGCFVSRI